MGWGEFFALSSALLWALAVILLSRSDESLAAFELNLFKNAFGMVLMVPTILLVLSEVFKATVQASEEAIVNAMVAAETVVGVSGFRVLEMPEDKVRMIFEGTDY